MLFLVHLIVAGLSLHTKRLSITDRNQRSNDLIYFLFINSARETHMNERGRGLGGSILTLQMVWVCFTEASGEKTLETVGKKKKKHLALVVEVKNYHPISQTHFPQSDQ